LMGETIGSGMRIIRGNLAMDGSGHRYNSKHYIPVLFDDVHPHADFGAVPDPSSLPAQRYVRAWWGFAGGAGRILPRIRDRPAIANPLRK
jgi:hypothetical protein